jgi:hypothetical protein
MPRPLPWLRDLLRAGDMETECRHPNRRPIRLPSPSAEATESKRKYLQFSKSLQGRTLISGYDPALGRQSAVVSRTEWTRTHRSRIEGMG